MFTDTHVRRADGPFEQQIVLSVVAILAFFFIIYLRRLMPHEISPWRALLHKAGRLAAFGAALLPLNRGLVFALVPIAIIDSFSKHRLISRRVWAAFFAMILLAADCARSCSIPDFMTIAFPGPDNVYQRVAQHQETLRVVRDYPFFGVGFGLYHDVASRNPQYMARWKGIESMNFPHNVLMTVLSEEGIVGLLFYVLAQVFLIRAMWKIRKAYPARLAGVSLLCSCLRADRPGLRHRLLSLISICFICLSLAYSTSCRPEWRAKTCLPN